MTDAQLPPPSATIPPAASPDQPWWKRKYLRLPTWAWITIIVLVIGGIGSATKKDDEDKQTTASPTVDASTADTDPADTQPAGTEPADTAPETTVERTTTTERATTTTADPGDIADLTVLLVLGQIRDGEAPQIVDAFVSDLEPFVLDRVDVVTAELGNEGLANVVIVGTSGYGTEQYQLEAAVDALTVCATLWDTDTFRDVKNVRPGLDLTVDGRQFLVPYDSIIAVLDRRMTPQAALGIG